MYENLKKSNYRACKGGEVPEKHQDLHLSWFGKWCRVCKFRCMSDSGQAPSVLWFYTEFGGFYGNFLLSHYMKSWPSWHFLWLFKRDMEKWSRKFTEASLLHVLYKCKRESTCWKRHESIFLHKFPVGIKEVLRVEHVWFLPLRLIF